MSNSRDKLKEQLESVKRNIIASSLTPEDTEAWLEKFIYLQRQIDIEPTIIHVAEKDLIKEYDNNSIVVLRCKGCIIWKMRGGLYRVVYPRMTAEYNFLIQLLDMKDNYDSLSKEEQAAYDAYYFGYFLLCQLPSALVSNDKWFFKAVNIAARGMSRFVNEVLNAPLQEETPIENAEFETKMEVAEELLEDGKDTD